MVEPTYAKVLRDGGCKVLHSWGHDLRGAVEWIEPEDPGFPEMRHYREWHMVPGKGLLQIDKMEQEWVIAQAFPGLWGEIVKAATRELDEAAKANSFLQAGEFERSVASFYATLLADQEPLGKEFERVLHENLWNLYSRS
jgi:hypothetical protein